MEVVDTVVADTGAARGVADREVARALETQAAAETARSIEAHSLSSQCRTHTS